MIGVKDAVKLAISAFADLFPNVSEQIRLEEVKLAEDGPWWNITLSFPKPGQQPTAKTLAAVLSGYEDREYKLVQIHRDNGELHSVKIRKP